MKSNKYEIDMCNGSIMDKLISFSMPLMLSGILQLMFNAVDIIVVGQFTGSEVTCCGWIDHGTDRGIYQLIYWNISWCQCTCGTFLCVWQA